MQEIEYVTAIDIDKKIQIRKDIGLIYEEDGQYKTLRVDFMENFGTLERYMMTSFETVNLNNFSEPTEKMMVDDDFEGKFVYKLVLEDGKVISHYYTFIGFEDEENISVVPTKIPLENKYTVDPRKVIATTWYYIKSNDDTEYVQTKDIINNISNPVQ